MKKIVLLGDSIRLIGYGPEVPVLLGDGYEVWQPEDNGRYSTYTLHAVMHYWLNEIRGADLIHWNNGLWDVQIGADGEPLTPLDVYVRTMCRIADLLRANAKTVVFASTTPVRNVHPNISNADVDRYNAALLPFLREKGILLDDLNALVKTDPDRYIRADDNIHLTAEGNALCAERVAGLIRELA